MNRSLTWIERRVVSSWSDRIRTTFEMAATKFDEPWGGKSGREEPNIPTGPSRTVPFQNLIRVVMDRPAAFNQGYSKFSTIYRQELKHWGQFDGSVGDLNGRSALAAFSAGATIANLRHPEIFNNIQQSSQHIKTLKGPRYRDLFSSEFAALDAKSMQRGPPINVRMSPCHSHRDRVHFEDDQESEEA